MAEELEPLEDERPAPGHGETPFDSVEGAHEFVVLLAEAIADAEVAIRQDITEARGGEVRRLEALQLVAFKLEKLAGHVTSSRRILNDLKILRRLLMGERSSRQEPPDA